MGWLKKIGRGFKKFFSKIGRGVKKAFKKFGKFMGKIGIVGQLAMMFILPGIGAALASSLGSMFGLQGVTGFSSLISKGAAALTNSSSMILKGAGKLLQGAHKFVSLAKQGYKTVTDGLVDFAKWGLNKIPSVTIPGAPVNLLTGSDSVLGNAKINAKAMFDPFRKSMTTTANSTLEGLSKTTGLDAGDLQAMNPGVTDWTTAGQTINTNWADIPFAGEVPPIQVTATSTPLSTETTYSETKVAQGESIPGVGEGTWQVDQTDAAWKRNRAMADMQSKYEAAVAGDPTSAYDAVRSYEATQFGDYGLPKTEAQRLAARTASDTAIEYAADQGKRPSLLQRQADQFMRDPIGNIKKGVKMYQQDRDIKDTEMPRYGGMHFPSRPLDIYQPIAGGMSPMEYQTSSTQPYAMAYGGGNQYMDLGRMMEQQMGPWGGTQSAYDQYFNMLSQWQQR